ncbi:MAG: ferredoxin domain-containing protein [Spirochaetota bacterium]
MARSYEQVSREALEQVARLMCVAARTAPKTRGRDHLIVRILEPGELEAAAGSMRALAERVSLPAFARDAELVLRSPCAVLIGVRSSTLGLNCGYCGYASCSELEATPGVCAFNSMDLGIAVGSAAAQAAALHADNRVMYTLGRGAMEAGLLEGAVQAVGIPLSATGKNPFFDRK